VPNTKVLEFGDNDARASYEYFLNHMAVTLQEIGMTPFVLVHESSADSEFAQTVAARAKIPCMRELDALALKHIAKQSVIMVGSRYHGLINALSQGVPAIGVSWSHKYRALFSDYERPSWLVDPSKPKEATELARSIISNRDMEREHLLGRSELLKHQSERMWAMVEEALSRA
jgi:colanic acid/amylovoran biosynthesis protein